MERDLRAEGLGPEDCCTETDAGSNSALIYSLAVEFDMSIFDQEIETENKGIAGGTSFYDIEDLYQAFKERMIKELRVSSGELLANAELVDISDS